MKKIVHFLYLTDILYTLIYVVPFYLSSTTRPSPQLSRDAPSVIRARIRAVTLSCVACTTLTLYIIASRGKATPLESLRLLGWWPINIIEIIKPTLLTTILFAGPLFEKGIAEGGWRDWIRGKRVTEVLGGWIGWRNFIAVRRDLFLNLTVPLLIKILQGPITEETVFRSCLIPLHLLAKVSPTHIVFYTPLYFGIAHIHHFYEYTLTHPHTPLLPALARSLFQFVYTSIFGFYAAFIYLRTGSLLAVIISHSFCNWCGLPRLWGRINVEAGVPLGPPTERKDDGEGRSVKERVQVADGKLGIGWTVAYYVFLVGGAMGFWWGLWGLTDSSRELASFDKGKGMVKG
ncbi:MAG: hypothetical protein M1812_003828 [Candelaria pacifica]|nr:MAG: hypothetical protein M1812_003828 [Candelaria pacifica]